MKLRRNFKSEILDSNLTFYNYTIVSWVTDTLSHPGPVVTLKSVTTINPVKDFRTNRKWWTTLSSPQKTYSRHSCESRKREEKCNSRDISVSPRRRKQSLRDQFSGRGIQVHGCLPSMTTIVTRDPVRRPPPPPMVDGLNLSDLNV